jgi:methylenetetrahydrofolate reductase (NADPH)
VESGNALPIHIGVPGVATIGTLIKHAAACGIGASAQFLKKQARNATKLLMNSTPERLLKELMDHRIQIPTVSLKSCMFIRSVVFASQRSGSTAFSRSLHQAK